MRCGGATDAVFKLTPHEIKLVSYASSEDWLVWYDHNHLDWQIKRPLKLGL